MSSPRLSWKVMTALSKRPSRLGETTRSTPRRWMSGGVLFRRWATKNAAKVATTRTANARRANPVTGG
jgi:hypothetical protein